MVMLNPPSKHAASELTPLYNGFAAYSDEPMYLDTTEKGRMFIRRALREYPFETDEWLASVFEGNASFRRTRVADEWLTALIDRNPELFDELMEYADRSGEAEKA